MIKLEDLKIKIFSDGADLDGMLRTYQTGLVSGLTTNPTLMKQANITDYEKFAKTVLSHIDSIPISFEVFSDDIDIMEKQARVISNWGKNVNVKIPITNTKGESTIPIIQKLADEGVQLNVTAIMTLEQVENVALALNPDVYSIVSVFAGRIADTGIDPIPLMKSASNVLMHNKMANLLWASPRELLNLFQAQRSGCKIITMQPSLIDKLKLVGKDLNEYSLDTVKMFYNDAKTAGYQIKLPQESSHYRT